MSPCITTTKTVVSGERVRWNAILNDKQFFCNKFNDIVAQVHVYTSPKERILVSSSCCVGNHQLCSRFHDNYYVICFWCHSHSFRMNWRASNYNKRAQCNFLLSWKKFGLNSNSFISKRWQMKADQMMGVACTVRCSFKTCMY